MNALAIKGPVYHHDLAQGTDEWLEARLGLLTASEMDLILTPTLKVASNDKERLHLYELLTQRITKRVEQGYQSEAMLRGHAEEAEARYVYEQRFAPVELCGFITNDKWGFKLGYSPDGLVGEDGLIECKSRMGKHQIRTIIECVEAECIPPEFMTQVQTGLLVSERSWCDFISYSNGLHMATIRVYPDPDHQAAIIAAATAFEARLAEKLAAYERALASPKARLIPTIYSPPAGDMFV